MSVGSCDHAVRRASGAEWGVGFGLRVAIDILVVGRMGEDISSGSFPVGVCSVSDPSGQEDGIGLQRPELTATDRLACRESRSFHTAGEMGSKDGAHSLAQLCPSSS